VDDKTSNVKPMIDEDLAREVREHTDQLQQKLIDSTLHKLAEEAALKLKEEGK